MVTSVAQIAAIAAQINEKAFYESIDQMFDQTYNTASLMASDLNEGLADVDAVVQVMGRDILGTVVNEGAEISLAESISPEFKSDVALLENISEVSIVSIHQLISEDFQAAVERILKSGRKLRMTSKDGKTKYKTRRRAAEAAAAASMAAIFGKKGVSRKAVQGKH